jgi:outer membrane receptor protein involved in Fe transport
VPSTQIVTGATLGSYVLPNETAEGWDYGFKGSFMQDKLTFTVGGFYVNQQHISVTANDANGLAIKQAVGDAVSKGGEFSANYFVTPDLAVNAGYFYTSARWVNTGNDLDMAGRRRAGVPGDIVTFATKYTFPFLRGLSTNWMYQYIGKSNAEERGNTTVTNNITPPGSNNGLRNIIRPGVALVNAGLAYDFRSRFFGQNWKQRLQFNVNNLTDQTYVTLSRGVGDRRTYYFTYQLSL